MKQKGLSVFQPSIAIFLLAAISLFILPKELIHEFYHHEDSTDLRCLDNCSGHVDNEHTHCDVLQLSTPPLYFHVNNFTFSSTVILCSVSVASTRNYHFHCSPCLFFRGPPLHA